MKNLFAQVALALSVIAAPAMLHAQAQDVAYGRLTVNFSPGFLSSVNGAGITITDLSGNALQNGSSVFTGVGGALDVTSAAGELMHDGGFILTVGSNTVRMQNLVIDTTNLSSPVIIALSIVNGSVTGRVPLFTLLAPPGFVTPLPSTAGTVLLSGIFIYIAPAAASELNSLLGSNVIPAGLAAGTETQYSVFSSYSGS